MSGKSDVFPYLVSLGGVNLDVLGVVVLREGGRGERVEQAVVLQQRTDVYNKKAASFPSARVLFDFFYRNLHVNRHYASNRRRSALASVLQTCFPLLRTRNDLEELSRWSIQQEALDDSREIGHDDNKGVKETLRGRRVKKAVLFNFANQFVSIFQSFQTTDDWKIPISPYFSTLFSNHFPYTEVARLSRIQFV